jgi:hypothetical protein
LFKTMKNIFGLSKPWFRNWKKCWLRIRIKWMRIRIPAVSVPLPVWYVVFPVKIFRFFARIFLNLICRLLWSGRLYWIQEDGQSQQGEALWRQMLRRRYGPYASGIFGDTGTGYPSRIVKQVRMVCYLLFLPV